MNSKLIIQQGRYFLTHHSSAILTGVGVVGSVGTAVLTGRATFKAAEVITRREGMLNNALDEGGTDVPKRIVLTNKEKIKTVWTLYIPPAATCALTVGSIVMAHRIDAKKIMALTAASGLAERALKEYKEKVVETFGEKGDTKVREELAQDHVTKNPPPDSMNREVVMPPNDKVLCTERMSGRYFYSTAEEIQAAVNMINRDLGSAMYSSLSQFYSEIGLSPTNLSDAVGWAVGEVVSVHLDSAKTDDNRPCLVVELQPNPTHDYDRRDY